MHRPPAVRGVNAADDLPGAQNLALFDDQERALIGTLFTRHSPEEAFREGRERTLAKIVDLTGSMAGLCGWRSPGVDLVARVERMTSVGIAGLERELVAGPAHARPGSVVLYCWRGGLRSRAMIAFVRGLGFDEVIGLEGGYRAYRHAVIAALERWEPPASFVLRGLTGVGNDLLTRRAQVVVDVLEVDVGHVDGEPLGHRLAVEQLQAAQPHVRHPARLALPPRDLVDDAVVDALLGGEGVLDGSSLQPSWYLVRSRSNEVMSSSRGFALPP